MTIVSYPDRIYKKKVPSDLRQRRGRTFIDEDFINQYPEDILSILAHFVVVRAEFDYCGRNVEYRGYCHLFEPISEGEELPEYSFFINKNWRGQITAIEAIRKEI